MVKIEEYAFKNCTSLTSVTIPASVTYLEGSEDYGSGMYGGYFYVFEGCDALREIKVALDNPVFSSQDGILYNKDGSVLICCPPGRNGEVIVSRSVTVVDEGAFDGCHGLAAVTIPSSVTSIGVGAFMGCKGLTVMFMGEEPQVWGGDIFSGATNVKVYVQPGQGWQGVPGMWQGVPVAYAPGAVSYWYDFNDDGGITLMGVASGMPSGSWVLPSTYDGYPVTAIGVDFPGTSKESLVTEVVIPASVRVIEDEAFDEMPKLKSVVLNEGLEEIGVDVFLSGKITSIKIPSTVVSMGPAAFGQNPLTKIEVVEGNPRYTVTDNGLLVDTWESKLQLSIRNQGNLVIPEGVEVIGCNSLEMVKLSSVDFPQSLRVLEDQAFGTGANKAGNFSFAELDFSRTQLKTVGGFVFVNNTQLKTVRFPATVESLGYWTFAHCSALTSVYFNGGVPEVTDPQRKDWIVDDFPDLLEYPDGDIYVETVGNPPPRLRNVTTYVTPDRGWEEICQSGTWQGRPVKMKTSVIVMAGEGGTATSGGSYDSGAKVSLKATAAAGYVFAGWYEKEGLPLEILGADYRTASVSYVAPARNVEIVAKFMTKEEDEANLSVANISAGEVFTVDGDWTKQVKVNSHSIPTVSAKGLPTGLKFNAKTLTISGRPTKPGRYDVELSLKNASVKTAKKFAFTVVVPNLKSEFIVGGVDYRSDAYVYIAGTRIDPILPELDEGVTLSASGLPAGLKLVGGKNGVPYSIEGASTAKPGSYTVTFTLKKGAVKETATITVNIENRTLTLGMAVVDGALTNGCKVTGGGSYAAGKKVTLKATAAKNCVFAGWYRDSTCTVPLEGAVDFRTASYSYVTKAENETIYALFLPAPEDTGIALVVDGNEVTSDAAETVFNTAGELTLALDVESVSVPKITVSGLPAGLKFTAKEVLNKDKTVLAEANTIYGTATKPGTYVVTAKLTNTTVKKAIEKKFTIVVDNLTGANDCFREPLRNGRGEKYVISAGVMEYDDVPSLMLKAVGSLKVSGLPSGMKYNAGKGCLEGRVTKAGTYTVSLTVNGKTSTFTLEVQPLPEWVVGSFEMVMAEENDLNQRIVAMISSSGDITLKWSEAGEYKLLSGSKKLKLSRGTVDEGFYFEYNDAGSDRGGTWKEHFEFTLCPHEVDGVVFGVIEGGGLSSGFDIESWGRDYWEDENQAFGVQNVWSRAAGTALCPAIGEGTQVELDMSDWTERGWDYQDDNYDLDGCFLVLTYGKNGNMSVAFFENGAAKASATAGTVLVPYELSADGKTLNALASVVLAPRGRHAISLALYFNIDVSAGVVYGSDFSLDHYYMENQ